jgi:uncharacterized protein YecE (DUF72 family)
MRVRVGTSGYAYPEWKGTFYPEDLPASKFLAHYAERFDTVELNNTYYRLPNASTVEGWASGVPAGFVYALKASQKITHFKRLRDTSNEVEYLFKVTAGLGEHRGPILFGLPPNLKKDLPRLADFLGALPAGGRAAFEFRHESWFADDVYDALRKHDVSLCVAEAEDLATPLVATASWGYLRLRREDYADKDMPVWAERISGQPWKEAFVYLKHEDAGRGPALARLLIDALPKSVGKRP